DADRRLGRPSGAGGSQHQLLGCAGGWAGGGRYAADRSVHGDGGGGSGHVGTGAGNPGRGGGVGATGRRYGERTGGARRGGGVGGGAAAQPGVRPTGFLT